MGRTFVIGLMLAACGCTPVKAPGGSSDSAQASRDVRRSCDDSDPDCDSPQQTVNADAAAAPGGARGDDPGGPSDASGGSHASDDDPANAAQAEPESSMNMVGSTAGGSSSTKTGRAEAGGSGESMPTDASTRDMAAAQTQSDAGGGGAAAPISTMGEDSPVDDTLVRPADADCDYVEVRARSDGDGAPYQVPAGRETVQCFLLDMGFEAPTQAIGFSALLDNPDVLVSIVVRTLERSENRGPLVTCNDTYPTHKMVAVWAPGSDDWYYPKDMGIDLGRGLFLLEVHYLNANGGALADRSGMRVCTTQQLRPRTASMSWLGSQAFSVPGGANNYPVAGRCTPSKQTEPIHILRVMPYMNRLGKRATMQIDRIDGSIQPVLDEAFMPSVHTIYDTPFTVRVSDSVLSTCYYDNPFPSSVSVGVSNDNELCHFFVLAYPAYALVNDSFSSENNSCLGAP